MYLCCNIRDCDTRPKTIMVLKLLSEFFIVYGKLMKRISILFVFIICYLNHEYIDVLCLFTVMFPKYFCNPLPSCEWSLFREMQRFSNMFKILTLAHKGCYWIIKICVSCNHEILFVGKFPYFIVSALHIFLKK